MEVRKGTERMNTMFGFDNAGSPVIRRVKFYEVEFADGYSIAIKGLARPTLEAASRFCYKEVAKCGPAVAVYDLTLDEVKAFFDTDNIDNWPVFGMPEDEEPEDEEPAPETGMLLDMFAGIPTAEVAAYEKSGDYGVAIIDPVAKAGKFIKAFGGFTYGTPECYDAAVWAKKINEASKATGNPARAFVVPLRFNSVTTILKKVAERAAPVPGEKNLC